MNTTTPSPDSERSELFKRFVRAALRRSKYINTTHDISPPEAEKILSHLDPGDRKA